MSRSLRRVADSGVLPMTPLAQSCVPSNVSSECADSRGKLVDLFLLGLDHGQERHAQQVVADAVNVAVVAGDDFGEQRRLTSSAMSPNSPLAPGNCCAGPMSRFPSPSLGYRYVGLRSYLTGRSCNTFRGSTSAEVTFSLYLMEDTLRPKWNPPSLPTQRA